MNKILLSLGSLLTISTTVPAVLLNQNNDSIKSSTYAEPKQITIKNCTVDTYGDDIILRTDPINLTALGIKNNAELNKYFAIELVDFQVNFLNTKTFTDGWKWGAKMSEGEGDWATIIATGVDYKGLWYDTKIERKHSLWYANGNYNLALVYRFNCYRGNEWVDSHGRILAQTGSVVKFY